MVDGSHNALYAQVSNFLMELDTPTLPNDNTVHPEDVPVLRLDAATKVEEHEDDASAFPSRCTYYIDKHEASDALKGATSFMMLLTCIRRIPNTKDPNKRQSTGAGDTLLDLLDVIG